MPPLRGKTAFMGFKRLPAILQATVSHYERANRGPALSDTVAFDWSRQMKWVYQAQPHGDTRSWLYAPSFLLACHAMLYHNTHNLRRQLEEHHRELSGDLALSTLLLHVPGWFANMEDSLAMMTKTELFLVMRCAFYR